MSNPKTNPSASESSDVSGVRRAAGDIADTAKETAASALNSAASGVTAQVDAARSSAADEVSGVASALRTAAEEMRSGSLQERALGQVAESLADASDALRDKDLSAAVQDVTRFARRNPLVFLGGAALVGFAATRFAKASGQAGSSTLNPSASSTSTIGEVS
jgi:phage-related protein